MRASGVRDWRLVFVHRRPCPLLDVFQACSSEERGALRGVCGALLHVRVPHAVGAASVLHNTKQRQAHGSNAGGSHAARGNVKVNYPKACLGTSLACVRVRRARTQQSSAPGSEGGGPSAASTGCCDADEPPSAATLARCSAAMSSSRLLLPLDKPRRNAGDSALTPRRSMQGHEDARSACRWHVQHRWFSTRKALHSSVRTHVLLSRLCGRVTRKAASLRREGGACWHAFGEFGGGAAGQQPSQPSHNTHEAHTAATSTSLTSPRRGPRRRRSCLRRRRSLSRGGHLRLGGRCRHCQRACARGWRAAAPDRS